MNQLDFDPLGHRISDVDLGHCKLQFLENGSGWRFHSILEKEPETIDWIKGFSKGDVLWDVGANVGIYSIYAASLGFRVVSFEPHFGNYFQFCVNIILNRFESLIVPLNLCIGSALEVSPFNMASLEFGASMSSFGSALDFRGREFKPAASIYSLGVPIDFIVNVHKIPRPNHLKIDVDGNELLVLRSAEEILKTNTIKSVMIELVETDATQISAVTRIFERAGFVLRFSTNNPKFATPDTRDVKNFLFVRH